MDLEAIKKWFESPIFRDYFRSAEAQHLNGHPFSTIGGGTLAEMLFHYTTLERLNWLVLTRLQRFSLIFPGF